MQMTPRPGQAYSLLLGTRDPAPVRIEHEPPEAGSPHNPYVPQSFEEAESLPSGAHFVDPTGALRMRY